MLAGTTINATRDPAIPVLESSTSSELQNLPAEGATKIAASDQAQTDHNPSYALWSVLIGFFLITMLMFIVTVALPQIRHDLGGGAGGILWVVNAYTLMLAALLLSAGAVSDKFGARNTYALGTALFLLTSIACAIAPNIEVLVAARFVQGAAAAMMMPATLALIRENFHDSAARARAIGLWATGASVGSLIGPLAGGVLLEFGWRMIFIIVIPFCLVSLLLLTRVSSGSVRDTPIDLVAQGASFIAVLAFVYWLIEGGLGGYLEPKALVAFGIAIVAGVAFARMQVTRLHPMVPPEVATHPAVLIPIVAAFAFTFTFTGLIFLLSLFYQDVLHVSPLRTGLAFIPVTALSVIFNNVSPRIAIRYGARVSIAAGLVLLAIALGAILIAASQEDVSGLAISLLATPIGIGGALVVTVSTQVLAGGVPAVLVGTASGLLNTARQVGSAVAIALTGVVIARAETFNGGFRLSLAIYVALAIVATGVTMLAFRHQLADEYS